MFIDCTTGKTLTIMKLTLENPKKISTEKIGKRASVTSGKNHEIYRNQILENNLLLPIKRKSTYKNISNI